MPKKKADSVGKLPKAVALVRERLAGKEISAQAIKDDLLPDELSKVTAAFRSVMTASQVAEYKALANNEERHQFMLPWILDPDEFKGQASNTITTSNSKHDASAGEWLTMEQIGSPCNMNSTAMAEAVCLAGDLEARPHELPSLAAKAIKQYFYTRSKLLRKTGTEDSASIESTAAIGKEHFAQVAAAMRESMSCASEGPPKKAARKVEKKPITQEEQAMREATSGKRVAFSKLHQTINKVRTDASQALPLTDQIGKSSLETLLSSCDKEYKSCQRQQRMQPHSMPPIS